MKNSKKHLFDNETPKNEHASHNDQESKCANLIQGYQ